MSQEMKNPYEEWGAHPENVHVGKRTAWFLSALFILIILLPPVLRNVHNTFCKKKNQWIPVVEFFYHPNAISQAALASKRSKHPAIEREQPNLQDHLRSFESKLEDAEYASAIRRWMQTKLTAVFGEGNNKAMIGDDGRLYYQPAIASLIGYGPLQPEPDSVMKNPDRASWTPPLPVITNFSQQLQQRGIELLLVPVPVKPMIYPEGIGKTQTGPVWHKDQQALYDELRQAGIEVLDLSELFWSMKDQQEVFLKQDTHWTQAAMQAAAKEVAAKIKGKDWFAETKGELKFTKHEINREHQGDLVGMLELVDGQNLFGKQKQTLQVITDSKTGKPVANDADSPIVLLGDSFVNIYDFPGIGFADPKWKSSDESDSEPLIGAGFAQHLAAQLQTPLNLYVANGGGATQVRKAFAKRPDNVVRAKKIVVWVLASRDLLLSEGPASSAGVFWRDVEFNQAIAKVTNTPIVEQSKAITIEATLTERTALQDPKSTPYKEAIYSALFAIDDASAKQLNIEGNEIPAYLWGFRKRTVVASGQLEAGKKYRITLVPWASKTNLQSVQKMDDLFVLSDWWFVEKVEAVE
ncbi:MAG: hypothetical protein L3J39_03535 [Verrucomicrobiales bacterium]|nr:hypothetical protein [Verrucomicrobiales bacterium]